MNHVFSGEPDIRARRKPASSSEEHIMLIPNWLKSLQRRRPRQIQQRVRRSRSQNKKSARVVEYLEDRTLLTSLNSVIDAVLDANDEPGGLFDPAGGPTTQEHVFTSADVPALASVNVGADAGGQADLGLSQVTLTFGAGLHFSGDSWSGSVGVEATSGNLYPGLLDIAISDDGNDPEEGHDADAFAVAGTIDLATGTAATLSLDDLDATDIGLPGFLDIAITDLGLNFDDFRGDDADSTLVLDASFEGIDTGSEILNDALGGSGLMVTGGVTGLELNLNAIRNGVRDAVSGDISFPTSPIVNLAGVTGAIEGPLFGAQVDGSFIVNTVTVDPDGAGPQPTESVLYAALEGSIEIENLAGFGFAFAFSELGPLQIFGHSDVDIPLEMRSGLVASNLRLGARFNTTIEDLQTETDFDATGASFDSDADTVTLTIPGHDLAVGNTFRVREADNSAYDGEFTVLAVAGDNVIYTVTGNPGVFSGSAEILRVTITDALDLRDSGLSSGVGPPEDIADWRTQLDQAVTNQILAGGNVWERAFSEFVLGGGATLSFDPRIPDEVLQFNVDFLIGTSFDGDDASVSLWAKGELSLYEDAVTIPASIYADLGTSDDEFSGSFLFLSELSPNVPDFQIDPLLVYRGEATFSPVDINDDDTVDGFSIGLQGGVDLNIPEVTTLALEGTTTITFTHVGSIIGMDLVFDVTLSESNVGTIASAVGEFRATIDTTTAAVEVWGAAILETDLGFLHDYGLFAGAFGLLRINTADVDKPDIELTDATGAPVTVALPAESFALRLDGSVDFRIDYNADGTFAESESSFEIVGTFVLEFSPNGFNVALFGEEEDGTVVPANLSLGVAGNTLLNFGVLGFLAIRDNGFASNLVLSVDASLPGGLASVAGAAVLVVNTTEEEVVFEIPGGSDPSRPGGLTMTIPAAAPLDPAGILTAPGPDGPSSGLDALISGSPEWTEGADGAYGVLFVDAEADLLEVLEFDVSGYVVLSPDVISLQVNLYAGGNFLGLASGSVSGSLFFSSEGEFEASITAEAQLGPDWININGGANLNISYLDNNGTASGGNGDFELDVSGALNVGLTVDISPFPSVDVSLDALTIGYNSASGDITVGVGYPEPFWDEYCVDLGFLGSACFPYPNVRTATYTFTVGTLVVEDPPPPPVLGQVSDSGVLTINAGSLENRTRRNLRIDEIDESVTIGAVGPVINGRQTITVRMFDVTQTFEGVTSINVANTDDGNDAVEILSGVGVPGNVHLGAGNDRLVNRGSGAVVAYGGAGDDRLRGSSASEQLFGGAGEDVIEGGGGDDTIRGGIGNDTLLVALRGDGSQEVNVSISNTGFTANIGDDPLSLITDIESLSIENEADRAESDTYTITYTSNTVGSVLSQVNLNLGADTVQDTVIVNGSEVADTFDISTSVVTRLETVPTGTGTETRTTMTDVDTVRVAQRGGVSLDIYDVGSGFGTDTVTINGLGASDTLNVNSTLTGVTTTVNGGGGADAINVGSNATAGTSGDLAGIAGSLVVNAGGGTDVLTLDSTADTDGATNGQLNPTTVVGLGIGAGFTYGSVESLNINLGTGADNFLVNGTHAQSTQINAGGGNDTVDVEATSGATTINGAAGSDTLRVNHTVGAEANALAGAVVLDGQAGADTYDVNTFGAGNSVVSVFDSGTVATETDTLTIDGTGGVDNFALQAANATGVAFVAAVRTGEVERVNYNAQLENLTVDTAGGIDHVTLGRNAGAPAISGETNTNISVLQQLRLNLGSDSVRDDVVAFGSAQADTFDLSTSGTVAHVARRGGVRVDIHEAGSNGETLTVNTYEDADTINVNATLGGITTTVNGGNGPDTVNVGSEASTSGSGNLKGIAGSLVVNGDNGSDVLNLDDSGNATGRTDGQLTGTTIGGSGIGAGITYDSIKTLNINLGSGDDSFLVTGTHGTDTQISGGAGADTIDVEAVSGATTILGSSGDDTLRVNNAVGPETNTLSAAVVLDGQAGADNYDVNIFGDGGSIVSVFDSGTSATETDTLTIDGTGNRDEFVLRASNVANVGFVAALHDEQVERVNYDVRLENLIVDTAGGSDVVTLGRGEDSFAIADELNTNISVLDRFSVRLGEDNVQDDVVVDGAATAETFDVSTDGSIFRVARRDDSIVDIHESGTGFGSDTLTVNAHSGGDTINVEGTLAGTTTTLNSGAGVDRVNVGSQASTSGSGNLEGVVGSLIVNGDNGSDVLNLDDTGDTAGDNDGQLTATTINGAGIGVGITYDSVSTLNVNLGSAADSFNVLSTHAGTTNIRGGGGNDTIDVEAVSGATNILGQDGDDTLRVNNVVGFETNGLSGGVLLDGQAGADNYEVNIFGDGGSVVSVFDSGTSVAENDTLTINGTGDGDDFVLRASNIADVGFVAALHGEQVERVNYDVRLENLIVDTAGGSDVVTLGRGEDGFAIADELNPNISVLDRFSVRLGEDSVQDDVVVDGAATAETFDVSTDGSIFRVARRADSIVDIHESGTGFGSDTLTVNAHSGGDTINVEGTLAGTTTTLNSGAGVDRINVGSQASTSGSGDLEGVVGSLIVNGDNGSDVLNLDDTGDTAGDTDGQLTGTTINGAGIGAGITYDSINTLNVNLGSAADSFNVLSTHAGTTNVRGGGGNDTINVESITGATNILGEDGDDNLRVNDVAAGESNGLATTLVLDGQAGSDDYGVNIFGTAGR